MKCKNLTQEEIQRRVKEGTLIYDPPDEYNPHTRTEIEMMKLLIAHGELQIYLKNNEYYCTLIEKDENGIPTNPISAWDKDLKIALWKLTEKLQGVV